MSEVVLSASALPAISRANVTAFLLACLKRAKGATVTWAELYVAYRRWCDEQSPAQFAIDVEMFGKKLDELRSEGIFRARVKGHDVHCIDVKLAGVPC